MTIFRRRFTIDCPFPVEETRRKLQAVVKTYAPACSKCGQMLAGGSAARFCAVCGQPVSARARSAYEFEGEVSPQGFRISRIISYRNCCIPVIDGRFFPVGAGTRIAIDMNMQALGYVLLIPGMVIPFFVLSLLIYGGDKQLSSAGLNFLPFAAPGFLWMICGVAFAVEAGTARAALDRIWASTGAAQANC